MEGETVPKADMDNLKAATARQINELRKELNATKVQLETAKTQGSSVQQELDSVMGKLTETERGDLKHSLEFNRLKREQQAELKALQGQVEEANRQRAILHVSEQYKIDPSELEGFVNAMEMENHALKQSLLRKPEPEAPPPEEQKMDAGGGQPAPPGRNDMFLQGLEELKRSGGVVGFTG